MGFDDKRHNWFDTFCDFNFLYYFSMLLSYVFSPINFFIRFHFIHFHFFNELYFLITPFKIKQPLWIILYLILKYSYKKKIIKRWYRRSPFSSNTVYKSDVFSFVLQWLTLNISTNENIRITPIPRSSVFQWIYWINVED